MDIFSSIWDWIVNFLTSALTFIVDLLPDSPFDLLYRLPVFPACLFFQCFFRDSSGRIYGGGRDFPGCGICPPRVL